MTHYPYDRLVDVRELRLTRAMDEVRRRKEARRSARSAADACRATLDALLAEREHRQHQLLRNDAGRLPTHFRRVMIECGHSSLCGEPRAAFR